jgi:hypothetical protein
MTPVPHKAQTTQSSGRQPGSPIRSIIAAVSLIGALVALPAGGLQMVRTLERGGYGSTAIDVALLWLGAGGALLAIGVSLLIWELSVRHNVRH